MKTLGGANPSDLYDMQTLVLGIGNTLLRDEGVGVHSIYYLKQMQGYSANTRIIDGGTLSFTLAADIEQADNLIVIDAADLNSQPGTVRTFVDEDMEQFLGQGKRKSVHEVGLLDLLQISRLSGHYPQRRALVGIQPQRLDWGDTPSEAVAAAIPVACQQVLQQIEQWQS